MGEPVPRIPTQRDDDAAPDTVSEPAEEQRAAQGGGSDLQNAVTVGALAWDCSRC
ncbi:hypothetical protein OHA72_32520 [Dactylosporangium sp. NBC_01737]|uniref:hypothetical protein n=1 Tax=Dactylosporangium sp. NBC_01737 TaxID=2975959 RepID=UPI002E10A106|nr:hypothetical protein OHA72_32520 [Dactylosporangium sp. NBC_01737]